MLIWRFTTCELQPEPSKRPGKSPWRGRLFFGVVESTFHLARLAHSEGRLSRAAEICRQGQADIAALLAHPERELPALGCLDIALGCVLLEQDRLDEAETHLLHGLDLIGGGMNPYYLMAAYLALFRLREIQGRSAEALDYLTRLEDAWPDIAFCTRGLRAAHALRTAVVDPGMLAEIAAWCQDFSSLIGEDAPLPGLGPFGAADAYYLAYLAWVRAQIATGNTQAARTTLERLLSMADAHDLKHRVIELSLLEAELEAKAGRAEEDNQRMWAALERALVSAQSEGYVRIFDQGPALTRLLVDAARRGIFQGVSRAPIVRHRDAGKSLYAAGGYSSRFRTDGLHRKPERARAGSAASRLSGSHQPGDRGAARDHGRNGEKPYEPYSRKAGCS